MLGNIHTLILSFCKNITDISMLGNVCNLDVYRCKNISKMQINYLKKTVKNIIYEKKICIIL